MKYTGKFTNIKGVNYTVNIITNISSTSTQNIVLAAQPVIIEQKNEDVFAPLKSRSCTISILTDNVIFDIYSSTAQGTKVEVIEESTNTKIFTGYVTPNLYTQNYVGLDSIEIECIEALSTLEYFEYEKVDNNGIISFKDIMLAAIRKCNAYKNIYYPNNLKLSSTDTSYLLDKLSISEYNFFDDDAERSAWNYKEVIEEMMLFLGWSMVVINDDVVCVDSTNNNTSYVKIVVSTGAQSTTTLSHNYTLTSSSHCAEIGRAHV